MKAQISMEYIFLYVFAMGVIMAAIATFSYLYLGDPDEVVPSTCSFTVGVNCEDFQIYSDGNVLLQLKNLKEEIYEPYLDCKYPNGVNSSGPVTPGKIGSGQRFNITCGSFVGAGLNSGDKVKINVRLFYHKNVTSFKNYRILEGNVVDKVQ